MGAVRPAVAHPIHTTYAEVQVSGSQATLTIRAFADDFATAVARFNRRSVPRDSAVAPDDVARYLADAVQVRDAQGRPVALVSCGVRRAGALTYACVRLSWTAGMRLTNRVLTDVHADQVNIVQQKGGPTLLFTRTDATRTVGS
jgi:hypothetical protein